MKESFASLGKTCPACVTVDIQNHQPKCPSRRTSPSRQRQARKKKTMKESCTLRGGQPKNIPGQSKPKYGRCLVANNNRCQTVKSLSLQATSGGSTDSSDGIRIEYDISVWPARRTSRDIVATQSQLCGPACRHKTVSLKSAKSDGRQKVSRGCHSIGLATNTRQKPDWMCVCVCVCMYVFVCLCMYVCMCVCDSNVINIGCVCVCCITLLDHFVVITLWCRFPQIKSVQYEKSVPSLPLLATESVCVCCFIFSVVFVFIRLS